MNILKLRRILSGSAPFLSGAFAILLAIAIVAAPESSFAASLQGLKLWWTLVFPALLPFLILSEMLTASGLVHGLGVLLAPLMSKVFRLPGIGGWTLALGMSAGFPSGANGVMQLHKQGSISDNEAGRLAALAHFASPVSLLIVVGTAFLHSPAAGYALLAIHWFSGLLAGCTSALIRRKPADSHAPDAAAGARHTKLPLFKRILKTAAEAREQDGRSFGRLLGESVSSAVQSLMLVGGYMIMFAVAINIVTSLIPQLPSALAAGLLEIHLGAKELASTRGADEGSMGVPGYALLSAALGWSGICGQLQALTSLRAAGVRFIPYAFSRLLHGLYAFIGTMLLWKPLMNIPTADLPAAAGIAPPAEPAGITPAAVWQTLPSLLSMHFMLLAVLLALSAAVYFLTLLRRPNG
ncbi:nucleoside recognition protein [Paenibacillus sp. PK3_47]|uniref:nucleoside recognition domain-containing protein n=1 Tax=Paenibacillus sp. PK3_47 TaxID=2072642 RepID=UPI00201D7D95|nr:nucleoside recognition domain-containing protein [Paenibacillus sp. PK3_47]UQZ36528.1 nucleoside recognition protein [Paenibacillus sp. PK3_47]